MKKVGSNPFTAQTLVQFRPGDAVSDSIAVGPTSGRMVPRKAVKSKPENRDENSERTALAGLLGGNSGTNTTCWRHGPNCIVD